MRRWLVVAAAIAAGCTSASPGPAAPPPERIVLVGDSVMGDVAAALDAATEGSAEVTYVLTIGTANAKDDWWDLWPRVVRDERPDAIAVLVGPWEIDRPDLGTAEWRRWYADRLDRWADLMTAGGAHVYWLDPLPVRDPLNQPKLAMLKQLYHELAARRDDVTVVDPTRALGSRSYLEHARSGARLRRVDGLHLCPAGSARVAKQLLEVLHLRGAPGWEFGPWRSTAPAYSPVECPD